MYYKQSGMIKTPEPNDNKRGECKIMFISREKVKQLRKEFSNGTRVRLIQMDDVQAPEVGTCGTVNGVDDTGSLMVHWDNGSSLHVIYGEDIVEHVN